MTTLALVGGAVLATVTPAVASAPPTRPCVAGELYPQIVEIASPSPSTSRGFAIVFRTKVGTCVLSGALDYIRFYDTSGRPLDVPFSTKSAVAPFEQVSVSETSAAVVYIWAPKGNGGGMPVGSMAFSVPTAPESEMKAAWPAPVDGPLKITKIVVPVS